jgi:hypothetical protein
MAIELPDEMPSRWLEQIRAIIMESAQETRRHFDVVAEGMRSEIRVIAEGHAMLSEKIDREFRRVDRRLTRLEARGR